MKNKIKKSEGHSKNSKTLIISLQMRRFTFLKNSERYVKALA